MAKLASSSMYQSQFFHHGLDLNKKYVWLQIEAHSWKSGEHL